jgi:hypothetical protein
MILLSYKNERGLKMETRILLMIEVLEKRLVEYKAEYQKNIKLDYENSNWLIQNNRGFYNGLITATQIELGHLQELLSIRRKIK